MDKFLILLLLIFFVSCDKKDDSIKPLPSAKNSTDIDNSGQIKLNDSAAVIVDLNSKLYDIRKLSKISNVMIYSCAPWCVWCVKDLPVIDKIDSLNGNKIQILYYETSKIKDTIELNKFISTYHLKYPVFSRQDNPGLWKFVNFDNKNLIPRISIINSLDKIIYDHIGYDPSIIDTIGKILK
jgi:thiol-disulfide isomerase/thioredoxin